MLIDTRIIHAVGAFEVLTQRHEVLWRDGTSVQLHPVLHHGLPSLLLRGLQLPGGAWTVIDLEQASRSLGLALRTTQDRDVPGTVFYTLRQQFTTARAFLAAARPAASSLPWFPQDTLRAAA